MTSPKKNFSILRVLLLLIIVIAIIVAVLMISSNSYEKGYQYGTNSQNNNVTQQKNTNTQPITDNANQNNTNSTSTKEISKNVDVLVSWYDDRVEISSEELFGQENTENSQAYIVGTIQNSEFAGDTLYAVVTQTMGTYQRFYLKHNNSLIMFDDDGKDCNDYLLCDEKRNITILNLETPDTISIPGSYITLIKKENYRYYQNFNDIENPEELFEYSPGKFIYQKINKENLSYFTIAEDNTLRTYQLNLNFLGEDGTASQYFGITPNMFNITWNDGSKNTEEFLQDYYFNLAGHSHNNPYYITNRETDLKITGQTNTGSNIYELKNLNLKAYDTDEVGILEKMYERYYGPYSAEKVTYEDFLTKHPVIFWEDPFGNLLEFKNAAYMPAAEMGKPVIYLYPEQTTNVSVQVFPNQGLTISEPEYNNGWLVKAYPDGKLYNYNDEKIYPYLFWEGNGINYNIPEKGFVVAGNEIEKFLQDKLSQLGLLPNEYQEFIDFWAPRMKEKPYYFVTFVPQDYFDTLAPLKIEPKPDTIIRVFMDYKGLDEKINVSPQIFSTPQRQGFTVIEWGGVLHN